MFRSQPSKRFTANHKRGLRQNAEEVGGGCFTVLHCADLQRVVKVPFLYEKSLTGRLFSRVWVEMELCFI